MKWLAVVLASHVAIAAPKLSLPKPRQADVFVRALHTNDPTARRVVLEELAGLAEQPAVQRAAPEILAIALDENTSLEQRRAALQALFAMPASAVNVESLWPLVTKPQDVGISGLAGAVLAKHGSQPDKLAKYLLVWIGSRDDDTRHAAAEALGLLGPRVLPLLRDQLAARHSDVGAIEIALETMGPAAAPILPDLYTRLDAVTDSYEHRRLRDTIAKLEGGASVALLKRELARDPKGALDWVSDVLPKLGPAGRPLLEPILTALAPDTSGLVLHALKPLITPADGALVARHVERMLAATDQYAQTVAAELLAAAGPPGRAVLARAFEQRSIPAIKVATAADLAQLETFAHDKNKQVRAAALEALGRLHDEAAVIAGTSDADPTVRYAAISALGHIPTPGSVAKLIALLKHRDVAIRMAAAEALAELGPVAAEAAPALVAAYGTLGMADATQIAGKLGASAVPALVAMIQHGSNEHAALALFEMGAGATSGAHELVQIANTNRSSRVREWVIRTLGRIGPAATFALPDLESMLLDPANDIVRAATSAIAQIGPPSAAGRKQLVKLATHSPVQSDALTALVRLGATPDLFPILRAAIRNPREVTSARQEAITALVTANDATPETLKVLREVMAHGDTIYVRAPAAEALLVLGDEQDLVAALVLLDGAIDARMKEDAKVRMSLP